MNATALILVLVAGFIHATWNLYAKRAGGEGITFVWMTNFVLMVMYSPVAIYAFFSGDLQLEFAQWVMVFGTGVLHIFYFWLLQKSYGHGDMSLIYPLARGTGPLISSMGGIFLLHEKASFFVWAGIGLITFGILLLTGDPRKLFKAKNEKAVMYGVLTGIAIAAYTVWDKTAVSMFGMKPWLYNYLPVPMEVAMLTPLMWPRRKKIKPMWKKLKKETIAISFLSQISYTLVLFAMAFSPVSRIAPTREISLLFGVILAGHFFEEKQIKSRLFAAACMFAGILALAFG